MTFLWYGDIKERTKIKTKLLGGWEETHFGKLVGNFH